LGHLRALSALTPGCHSFSESGSCLSDQRGGDHNHCRPNLKFLIEWNL
jgi:hypothetical protein